MQTLTQEQWDAMTTMERNAVVQTHIFGVGFPSCSYTADYNAAFMVLDEMRKEGWEVLFSSRNGWLVLFEKENEEHHTLAESMPLAICEAALKAKGVLC